MSERRRFLGKKTKGGMDTLKNMLKDGGSHRDRDMVRERGRARGKEDLIKKENKKFRLCYFSYVPRFQFREAFHPMSNDVV